MQIKKKKENYAAALMRSLFSVFEEHTLNFLHCSIKITQGIILAIQLCKKSTVQSTGNNAEKSTLVQAKDKNFQKY